jgi:ankyrin repeat protein
MSSGFRGRFFGCSPNVRNATGATPLHLAALCGHEKVVEILVTHPKIDLNAKDKDNKTALDLCSSHPLPDWQACARKIEAALNRPKQVAKVHLMDGRKKDLVLNSGYETTVDELNHQMSQILHISPAENAPTHYGPGAAQHHRNR